MLGAVGELRLGPHAKQTQRGVPGEGPEADDDAGFQQCQFVGCVGETGIAFLGGGLVQRGGAADGGGDPGSREPQSVIFAPRYGTVREVRPVERGEEEVSGAVAGEEAARAVRPVRGGSEAEYDDRRVRVSEAGDGAAPVSLVLMGGLLLAGDLLAPLDEPRTAAAGRNLALQRGELLPFVYGSLTRRSGSA